MTVKDEKTTKLQLAMDMGKLEKQKNQPIIVKVEETTKLELVMDMGQVREIKEPASDSER